eukprot:1141146-Pelagomonas_calceolata.AAC.4
MFQAMRPVCVMGCSSSDRSLQPHVMSCKDQKTMLVCQMVAMTRFAAPNVYMKSKCEEMQLLKVRTHEDQTTVALPNRRRDAEFCCCWKHIICLELRTRKRWKHQTAVSMPTGCYDTDSCSSRVN